MKRLRKPHPYLATLGEAVAGPGFTARLVPRIPAAQPTSQALAEPAAPASLRAGAAFHHFTETCPLAAADGQAETAPEGATSGAALSITISPAVALILKLAGDATGLAADEIIARGICIYADRIGIPTLARSATDEVGDDLGEVPHFIRRDQRRFTSARETLRDENRGMRK